MRIEVRNVRILLIRVLQFCMYDEAYLITLRNSPTIKCHPHPTEQKSEEELPSSRYYITQDNDMCLPFCMKLCGVNRHFSRILMLYSTWILVRFVTTQLNV
ncbi:hypothetical protein M8J75_009325 [Diaphorina citri]|nr:hypothetical protein M8J75_009325 [Diaphorina citri]